MKHTDKFFSIIRNELFGGSLTQSQVDGINAILNVTDDQIIPYRAYQLATAYHETGMTKTVGGKKKLIRTMEPVREQGSDEYLRQNYDITGKNPTRAKSMGNTTPGDGVKYCGRGFVQLTWKDNYAAMSKLLGVDLVNNPDLAMQPDVAAKIMTVGMLRGTFTGKKMSDYLNKATPDYFNARRVVNGTDQASTIAGHAKKFEAALKAAA